MTDYKQEYERVKADFAKETLRTSKLAEACAKAAEYFIDDGHSTAVWSKNDRQCEALQVIMGALKDTMYYAELKAREAHR
jgi:hypothetical protein